MPATPQPLHVRCHGRKGRPAIVLHGGPGAPGSAAALARALADPLHVIEPWQRWSSSTPLTVAQHVADLADVVFRHAGGENPAIVGESWGAMLALVFASRYPDLVSALVLIGCGTFHQRARDRLRRTLAQRTTPEMQTRLARLDAEFPDEAERLAQRHRVSEPIYTYCRAPDTAPDANELVERFDLKGHRETWNDMVRLQASGAYPAGFRPIKCPVLMLHGAYDPHPGRMIRDSLRAHVPQLEYHELEKCGHSPWVEAHARDRFLATVRRWLEQHV